ncbi:MAG: SPOR domain-containing protein, partial [Alphaproteobacteria bacterium]|nr:SPOR domain-containing protein [Alphaproteobacteria bacterium]
SAPGAAPRRRAPATASNRVRVTTQPGTRSPAENAAIGKFKAQVGAFRLAENAKARCHALAEQGFSFTVEREKGPSGHDLFFCRSERAYSRADAQAIIELLRRRSAAPDAIITAAHDEHHRS